MTIPMRGDDRIACFTRKNAAREMTWSAVELHRTYSFEHYLIEVNPRNDETGNWGAASNLATGRKQRERHRGTGSRVRHRRCHVRAGFDGNRRGADSRHRRIRVIV